MAATLFRVSRRAQAIAMRYPASARTTRATVINVSVKSMAASSRAAFFQHGGDSIELPLHGSGRAEHLARHRNGSVERPDVRRVAGNAGGRLQRLGSVSLYRPGRPPRAMERVHGQRHEDDQRDDQAGPPDRVDSLRDRRGAHRPACLETAAISMARFPSMVRRPSRTALRPTLSLVTCGAKASVCRSMARTPRRILARKLAGTLNRVAGPPIVSSSLSIARRKRAKATNSAPAPTTEISASKTMAFIASAP